MAGKKFDMGDFAKTLNIPVSNLGTEREQIEYIDIGLLDADANNFYQLSDVEELAANIEFVGLQQPLRVRENPDQPGRWIVVSGHRRRAALQKLVDGGREDLRAVPCIREQAAGSAALQELRLIYANSDTRKMTSAEISQQAERVEMLLYQLKKEGIEFPGRMRDHVAEACKVSKSKLARLKVIRDKLIPEFDKYYKAGKLKEASAYALAQQPPEVQKLVRKYTEEKDMQYLSEWQVDNTVGKITPVIGRKCKKQSGAACTHKTAMLEKLFDGNYGYKPCDRVCCDKCDNLASCKTACPLLFEKVKRLRADRRAQNAQEKAAKAAKDQPVIDEISEFWRREAAARAASGKSVKALFAATESYYSQDNEQSWVENETLQKIRKDTLLPFGQYGFYLGEAHRLIATAKCLGVTTDYLLGLSDDPHGAYTSDSADVEVEEPRAELIRWENRGKTPPIGALILTYDLTNNGPVLRPAVWDGNHFHAPGNPGKVLTGLQYTQWLRIPMAHSGETYQLDNSPAEPAPCVACKSAHPGCDKCCTACEDHCNAWQTCRRECDAVSATCAPVNAAGPIWYSQSVAPEVNQDIIVVGSTGYAEDARFIGNGALNGGALSWDDVMFWTPAPTGPTADKRVEPPAEGWVPLQYVDGQERPPRDGLYYCTFDCDGHIVSQTAWWDGFAHEWRFKQSGIIIDADCVGWFPLPTVEDAP